MVYSKFMWSQVIHSSMTFKCYNERFPIQFFSFSNSLDTYSYWLMIIDYSRISWREKQSCIEVWLQACLGDCVSDNRNRHFQQNVLINGFSSLENLLNELSLETQLLPFGSWQARNGNSRWRKPPFHAVPSTSAPSFSSAATFRIPKLHVHHWIQRFLTPKLSLTVMTRKGAAKSQTVNRPPLTISIESSFRSAGRFMWMSERVLGVIICTVHYNKRP